MFVCENKFLYVYCVWVGWWSEKKLKEVEIIVFLEMNKFIGGINGSID